MILVTFLAVWWLSPLLLRSFLKVTFYEFQAPVLTLPSYLRDLQYYWVLRNHSKRELIEAGRDLARQNAAYALERKSKRALSNRITELEELLNLPPPPGYRHEVARVLHRQMNAWWQQIIIDKGTQYNIPESAAVIFAGGVVGRIRKVHAYTSTVQLVTSPDFRIAAHFEDDSRPVTYQGRPHLSFHLPAGKVRDVSMDLATSSGTTRSLVTSQLGGVFPTGIPIGQVGQLSPAANGLFLEGKVELDKRLLSVEEVVILIPIELNDAGN